MENWVKFLYCPVFFGHLYTLRKNWEKANIFWNWDSPEMKIYMNNL